MFQVSMGGPSTNWKFLDDLNKHRKDYQMPQLTNIGSCSLHVIHGVFKTAIESIICKLIDSCSKSFLNVKNAVKDKLILLKFDVFSFIASILEPICWLTKLTSQ